MDWRRRPRVAPASAQRRSDGGREEPIRPDRGRGPIGGDREPWGSFRGDGKRKRRGRSKRARSRAVAVSDALAGVPRGARAGRAVVMVLLVPGLGR
jgi:hypothetical protein